MSLYKAVEMIMTEMEKEAKEKTDSRLSHYVSMLKISLKTAEEENTPFVIQQGVTPDKAAIKQIVDRINTTPDWRIKKAEREFEERKILSELDESGFSYALLVGGKSDGDSIPVDPNSVVGAIIRTGGETYKKSADGNWYYVQE